MPDYTEMSAEELAEMVRIRIPRWKEVSKEITRKNEEAHAALNELEKRAADDEDGEDVRAPKG